MFRNPFSFEGRIKHREYGLSVIAVLFAIVIAFALIRVPGRIGMLAGAILFLTTMWFIFAQGAKRCHDLGKSGWWQCVPLYFVSMVVEPGELGRNEYDVRAEPSDIYPDDTSQPPPEREPEDADGPPGK